MINLEKWFKFEDIKPLETDLEVLVYSEKYIHPDFNPDGTRVGFINDGVFTSAKWNDSGDAYMNDTENPTHWKYLTKEVETGQLSIYSEKFEDIENIILKLFPTVEYGESEDCEELWNLIQEIKTFTV